MMCTVQYSNHDVSSRKWNNLPCFTSKIIETCSPSEQICFINKNIAVHCVRLMLQSVVMCLVVL